MKGRQSPSLPTLRSLRCGGDERKGLVGAIKTLLKHLWKLEASTV
jgi:hypothetical protein